MSQCLHMVLFLDLTSWWIQASTFQDSIGDEPVLAPLHPALEHDGDVQGLQPVDDLEGALVVDTVGAFLQLEGLHNQSQFLSLNLQQEEISKTQPPLKSLQPVGDDFKG